jgi:hypothetical protein
MGHGDVGTPCFWSGGILWAAPIQMNFWHSGGHPSEAVGFYVYSYSVRNMSFSIYLGAHILGTVLIVFIRIHDFSHRGQVHARYTIGTWYIISYRASFTLVAYTCAYDGGGSRMVCFRPNRVSMAFTFYLLCLSRYLITYLDMYRLALPVHFANC